MGAAGVEARPRTGMRRFLFGRGVGVEGGDHATGPDVLTLDQGPRPKTGLRRFLFGARQEDEGGSDAAVPDVLTLERPSPTSGTTAMQMADGSLTAHVTAGEEPRPRTGVRRFLF